jgi:hypothetical protein
LLQPLKALLLLALLAAAAGRLVKGKAVSEGKEQGLFYDPVTGYYCCSRCWPLLQAAW